jgi:hypothetical protein
VKGFSDDKFTGFSFIFNRFSRDGGSGWLAGLKWKISICPLEKRQRNFTAQPRNDFLKDEGPLGDQPQSRS